MNDGSDAPTGDDALALDMLAKVYNGLQEQVRFADTKAGVVAAFNAILVGFIASNVGTVKGIYGLTHDLRICVVLIAGLLATGVLAAVSIGFLIWAVRPRIGNNTRTSKLFFGHIARDYQRDGARYAQAVRAMSRDDWADDFGQQIVEVAAIASKKHAHLRTSMTFTFCAIVSLVSVSLVVHVVSVLHDY